MCIRDRPGQEQSQDEEQHQQQEHAEVPVPESSGPFENMGYNPNETSNPNVTNMGWEDQNTHGGAPTPGAPSMGAPTPYRDDEFEDYDGPASVQNKDEEMQENETIEEFEDRVLNKRAAHLNTILKSKLEIMEELKFSGLPMRRMRKAVAQNFYSLLVLQKVNAVELEQEEGFSGELKIRKGPNFETAVL